MNGKPLKILYLEDCDEDVELVQVVLADRLGPCTILRAEDQPSFECGLQDEAVDLVLSDYALPTFDGMAALAMAKALRPGLPFVLFSGNVNEALARECLRRGADGCTGKQQLGQLPMVLRKALEKSRRMD